jgi:hypothetical protein
MLTIGRINRLLRCLNSAGILQHLSPLSSKVSNVDQNNSGMTAQERFAQQYITSTEICEEVGVARATILHARRRKLLPNAIVVNNVYIWEREPVRPYIEAWKLILNVRRGTHDSTGE